MAVFVCVAPHHAVAAFGISPPFMHPTNLIPGSHYSQTIYLVQDKPDTDLGMRAILNVPDSIRPWFHIIPGERFSIPKGVRQFPVEIVADIPKDTGLGAYNGKLSFQTAPTSGGQVSIALGAEVDIALTVGNDIVRKIVVPIIRPLDIEEGWDPSVYIKVDNEGNVAERFNGAIFELYDQFGAGRLAYVQKQDGFPEIPAFSTQEFTLEFPTNFYIGVGQYWASITLLRDGKVEASAKTVFNVLKKGSIHTVTERFIRDLKKQWPYYAGGAAVLVVVSALFLIRRKRRSRRQ
ncbi:MAG: putative transrane protein [Candidatus Parcubacteria bacterium]